MTNHYWSEITIGFIIIIVATGVFLFFYKPIPQTQEGFSEEFCISLLAKHNKDAENVEFESIRSGSTLYKEAVLGETNNTIRVFLQANRYEGILEYCRLSTFSSRSLINFEKKFTFSCNLGELSMTYGQNDDYKFIIQEIRLTNEKRSEFLKDILNFTAIDNLSQETFQEGFGVEDIYQSSAIYINPDLPDIYGTHLDAFIDTMTILKCSGELPQEFVDLSNYRPKITVQVK